MSHLRSGRLPFRPDIEGLRAVAVVLIVLFHAGVPGFGGGFVGVDVFYVISGFLITGLLVDEFGREGRISLPDFYARRARRILPAAALVLVATLVASKFVLAPLALPRVAGDAAASALYVANYRFAAQATQYMNVGAAPSPLLHYWSLAVEEQFYIVWPAVLFASLRRRRAALVVGVIGVASFGASWWLTRENQPWAFFSLPTRAWELLAGAALALSSARLARLPRRPAAVAGVAGIALIVTASVVLGPTTSFPGVWVLLPVAGTTLIVAAGLGDVDSSGVARRRGVGRALALPPAQLVGRLSYSVYLWHWPVLTLFATARGRALSGAEVGAGIVLTIAGASLAFRLVENPIRARAFFARRRAALVGGVALAVVVCLVAFAASQDASRRIGSEEATQLPAEPDISGGLPRSVPDDLVPPLDYAARDVAFEHLFQIGCISGPYGPIQPRTCSLGDSEARTRIVLFGDSHAANWSPAIEAAGARRGWRVTPLMMNLCPAADARTWLNANNRYHTECSAWRDAAFEFVEKVHPQLVIVANGSGYTRGPHMPRGPTTDEWRLGFNAALRRLKRSAERVVLFSDIPTPERDAPTCLSSHLSKVAECGEPVTDYDRQRLDAERKIAQSAGVGFVDTTGWACPDDLCYPIRGRVLVFTQQNHLTITYARALAGRLTTTIDGLLGADADRR